MAVLVPLQDQIGRVSGIGCSSQALLWMLVRVDDRMIVETMLFPVRLLEIKSARNYDYSHYFRAGFISWASAPLLTVRQFPCQLGQVDQADSRDWCREGAVCGEKRCYQCLVGENMPQ